jgi:hypothetical protein
MATNQKIRPCPQCGSADDVAVYKYDNGWCYVECNNGFNAVGKKSCRYLGPGEGSVRQAIKSHNEKCQLTHQQEVGEVVRHGPGSS